MRVHTSLGRFASRWVLLAYWTQSSAALALAGPASLALDPASTPPGCPAGNGPRGLQVGRIAGQNLADNFQTIDHFEDGAVVSIKSTTAIEDQGRLLQNIGNWAAEMDDVGPLRGRSADGRPITITPDQIRTKGLLVAIPHEPVPWNAAAFMSQVRRISQLYRTSIRVVTVRGLRGK